MPENNLSEQENKPLSLYRLNKIIGDSIRQAFPGEYWVVAEINEMSVASNGHCYLEVIEKSTETDQVVARSRAIIWSYTFRMLRPYFETTTGKSLSPGIKILFLCEVTFHELYGISLIVKDIEPGYTLGDLALRRQEVIRQLKQEGIFDMNRRLPLPLVPQRIALISSQKAAGLKDFITHLEEDPHHYHFQWKLFPAAMQGIDTEPTIIGALEMINEDPGTYDVVIIIRGGGAKTDLSAFDQYRLAAHIAQFPLPVITGIGHEKDESVTDLVARVSLKTPTAVAQFLIDRIEEFEFSVSENVKRIVEKTQHILLANASRLQKDAYEIINSGMQKITASENLLHHLKYQLRYIAKRIPERHIEKISLKAESMQKTVTRIVKTQYDKLDKTKQQLSNSVKIFFQKQENKIGFSTNTLNLLDPLNILKRGYSITRIHQKAIRDATVLQKGNIIETQFMNGKKKSRII